MSTAATTNPSVIVRARSFGAKFFLITCLALLMSLSGFFVEGLVTERAQNRGVLAASYESPKEIPATVLGIRIADNYRALRRSLHYIPLFLGLVFLTYFLFEASHGRSLHPAQYALAGLAQIIFYLLLLSFSEHIGFDWSFLLAGASTVALFTANTEWVFQSRPLAVRAFGIFAALYVFIYILLRVEAYALLVGACASFIAVAAAMYVTRRLDWSGTNTPHARYAAAAANGPAPRESWLD